MTYKNSGGVVSAQYFQQVFGIANADGSINVSRKDEVSSNVVSVLQAGAFFGALGSAPMSGKPELDSIAACDCGSPSWRVLVTDYFCL